MELRAAAERAHRLAQLGLDERVDDDRRPALHPVDRELQVGDRLDARMPDLEELLLRELRLERLHEALRRLAGRVGDDVELDLGHRPHLNHLLVQLLGIAGILWAVKRLLVVLLAALALPASAFAWGGSYPTGDSLGSFVKIQVSDSYPVDQALPQDWATYLGTLLHGPEISRLTLNLVPEDVVQANCGAQALACYDPNRQAICASPEDQLNEPPAKEIVTHEYGHHLAKSSDDAPWAAIDYGTKRWSSYENICAKAAAGTASPGDEGTHYFQNSGEAFAEAYRVLNLEKQGHAESPAGTSSTAASSRMRPRSRCSRRT